MNGAQIITTLLNSKDDAPKSESTGYDFTARFLASIVLLTSVILWGWFFWVALGLSSC